MEVGRAELGTTVLLDWCVWFKIEAAGNFWKFGNPPYCPAIEWYPCRPGHLRAGQHLTLFFRLYDLSPCSL